MHLNYMHIVYYFLGSMLSLPECYLVQQPHDDLPPDGKLSTLQTPTGGGWYTFYPNAASYRTAGPSPLPQVIIFYSLFTFQIQTNKYSIPVPYNKHSYFFEPELKRYFFIKYLNVNICNCSLLKIAI